MRIILPIIVLSMLATGIYGQQSQDSKIAILADGTRFDTTSIMISQNSSIMLGSSSGPRIVEPRDFVAWGEFVEVESGPAILLEGGSILRGELLGIDAQEVVCECPLFGQITVPREHVIALIFRLPIDREKRDQLMQQLESGGRSSDEVWMRNGDQIQGRAISRLPAAGQAPRVMDEIEIHTESAVNPSIASIESVVAIVARSHREAGPTLQPKVGILGLRDGSRLRVDQFNLSNNQVEIRLDGGTPLTAPADMFWGGVSALQYLGEHLRYVSDIPEIDYRHIAYLSTAWKLGVDRNAEGGLLRHQGRVYPKGLGMHSNSRCAFRVDGQFRRLDGHVGIDDASTQRGSVVFRIYVERRGTVSEDASWRLAYESPIVRAGEPLRHISADIAGALRVALVVDMADRGDEGDYADWLNVRLIP